MPKKGVSGTKEWSASSANCMDGCANDCLYCYAKQNAVRFGRCDPDEWHIEEPKHDLIDKNYGRRNGRVMFPTTHDLTRNNIGYCEEVLTKLLASYNEILVVSKPDSAVIERLCNRLCMWNENLAKKNVLFRFTIGAMDSIVLRFWEPNAPSYEERLYSLMWCFKNGWQTSVSMEPMLQPAVSSNVQLVHSLAPYVTDAIWLGKMNNPKARVSVNFGGDVPDIVAVALQELIDSQADVHIERLYKKLKGRPKVKWKESIKKVVGLEVPTEAGLDE